MAQSTKNVQQVYEIQGDEAHEDYPVVALATIYEGDAVGAQAAGTPAGGARQLVAADNFLGFAVRKTDSTADAVGGANQSRVRTRGHIQLTVAAGGTLAGNASDVGLAVYASDGATFTGSAGGNSKIGVIERWISTTSYIVAFRGIGVLQS